MQASRKRSHRLVQTQRIVDNALLPLHEINVENTLRPQGQGRAETLAGIEQV
jgi:hypothetical protein